MNNHDHEIVRAPHFAQGAKRAMLFDIWNSRMPVATAGSDYRIPEMQG